jgi:hypothetical protein
MIRIDRHELGPRVYVVGRRVHECTVGAGVLASLLAGGLAERWELTRGIAATAAFGAFLIVKDWRDLFPSRRDTARWSPLLHRLPRR